MSNPHRTLAFYGLALSVIVAWACLGCVVRTANGQDARNPSDGVADRDRAYFPEAMALHDKSDAALGAQRYDDAIALARQVDPKVDEEKVHVEKTVAAGEAEWRIRDAAIVLEGLALRGAGRDLDALLAIRDRNFHAGACGDSLLARCGEHADWLKKTFPGVVKRAESISGRSATLTLWLDSAAQPDGVLDARAMHATMTMTEREIKAKTGYAGLLIEPMSSNGGKGGVTLRVEATGFQATSEECNKVGQLRIGGADFDVARCHQQGYTVRGAKFSATVLTDDAKKLTGAKGERVFIVFETKNWKNNGDAWAVTSARVAYVTPPSKK